MGVDMLLLFPSPHPQAGVERVGGQLMVLSPNGEFLHSFIEQDEQPSQTGELIYSLADGSRSLQDIVEAVLKSFNGATRPQVQADVVSFVQGLVDKNVLVLNQTPTNR